MSGRFSVRGIHTQIEQLSHLEVSPYAKIIVQVDLTNGHPLEVRTDCVHLARVYTDSTELQEGSLSIIHTTRTITIAVVRHLMIIPGRNPCEVLVGKAQIKVSTVLANTRSVVVKTEDLSSGSCCARVFTKTALATLVDVISKVNLRSQICFSRVTLRAAFP
jgi:hypothetical protein